MKFNTFILIEICFLFRVAVCWRSFEFRFRNVDCAKRSEVAGFINCTLSNLPKQDKGLSFTLQVSRKIKKPKLDFLLETTRQDQPNFIIANLTRLDGCQFLENRGIINIMKVIREYFDKYSNMPKKCPVAKDTLIIVKDLVMDPNSFPPYVPETSFVVTLKLWEEITPVFDIVVKGNVKTKNRKIRLPLKN